MNVALDSEGKASGVSTRNGFDSLSEEAVDVLAALLEEAGGLGVEGARVVLSALHGVLVEFDLLLGGVLLNSTAQSLAVLMVAVASGVEESVALGVVAIFTFDGFVLLAGEGGLLAEETSFTGSEARVGAGGVHSAVERRCALSGKALVGSPDGPALFARLAIATSGGDVHALSVVEAVESSAALVGSSAFFELGETLAGGVAVEAVAIGIDSALVSDKAAHLGFLANVVLEGLVVVAIVEQVRALLFAFAGMLALVSNCVLGLAVLGGVAEIGSWALMENCAVVAVILASSISSGDITLHLEAHVGVSLESLACEGGVGLLLFGGEQHGLGVESGAQVEEGEEHQNSGNDENAG